jgi:hypothetical protein
MIFCFLQGTEKGRTSGDFAATQPNAPAINPIPNPRMRRQILLGSKFLAGPILASSSAIHRIRLKRRGMVAGNPAASKNRDRRWLPRAAVTTLGVVLLVVSTAG